MIREAGGDDLPVKFELLSDLREVSVIASGRGVRIRHLLDSRHGRGKWRKMKGVALVRTDAGETYEAEIHRYEAHGIGKRDFKIKTSVG